ncbi:MAG: hypothetical protein ACLFU2_12110 [Opitutales bacterium]
MPTKSRAPLLLLVCTLGGLLGSEVLAQAGVDAEREAAAALLALGEPADAKESGDAGGGSVADRMTHYRSALRDDRSLQEATRDRAHRDAFGLTLEAGPQGWSLPRDTGPLYVDYIEAALDWLKGHPEVYREVIERAYAEVVHRAPYAEELAYWRERGPLSFVLLAGGIEDWARRNQPGLMVTTGVATVSIRSEFLTTQRLSPEVAAETRGAVGMEPEAVDGGVRTIRHHVIAPGAERIASRGGIHFIAVGAPGLRETTGR